jgi:hypothetical protein
MRPTVLPHVVFSAAFALVLALASADSVSAQFGLRGGINLSRFVGQDADRDSHAGLNLGASIPLFRVGPLRIVPEVYYAKRGGTALGPTAASTLDFELSYLEVPLLLRLYAPMGAGLKGYVGGGPAYAWNLDCKFTAGSDTDAAARECGQPFQSFETAKSSADKGVVFNAGIDLPVFAGLGGLNLDGRLVRGLDRVIEGESGGGADVRNRSITVMLGYYLGF